QRHRLCPRKSRALALRVIRTFLPRVEGIEALFRLSGGAQIFPVHVQAVRTAVYLGCAQRDQMHERPLETTGREVLVQRVHGGVDTGRDSPKNSIEPSSVVLILSC